jgi:hypothetical protein
MCERCAVTQKYSKRQHSEAGQAEQPSRELGVPGITSFGVCPPSFEGQEVLACSLISNRTKSLRDKRVNRPAAALVTNPARWSGTSPIPSTTSRCNRFTPIHPGCYPLARGVPQEIDAR